VNTLKLKNNNELWLNPPDGEFELMCYKFKDIYIFIIDYIRVILSNYFMLIDSLQKKRKIKWNIKL